MNEQSSKPKPPRHSYLTRKRLEYIEAQFEQAMIDVANAEDGHGNVVRLFPFTDPTAANLRECTRTFMSGMIDGNTVFIGLNGKTLIESQQSEIAAWTNLALLARATAAAVRHESAGTAR